MITLLAKLFIRDNQNYTHPKTRQAYGILSGCVGIGLNILLFLGKFFAGSVSHSIAITADAFNNLSDAGSSVITLIGFKVAGNKPDADHPFGHGRVEYIAGLFVSVVILFMAFELIKSSVIKIFQPIEQSYSTVVIVILLVSILVKCYMSLYNHKISKKINSAAMKATATDSLSDALSTTVVLIASLTAHFTGIQIDGYCGVAVGLFIFYAGYNAAKDTISPLLGQSPDPEFVQQIEDIVMSYENIIGIHDLIVHNYGPNRVLISLHVEVPADGNILQLHDIIDLIEHKLRETLHCSAVIHMDPVCVGDEETEYLKQFVKNYLAEIDEIISIHDFRIVKRATHTNIIFDLLVPYNFRLSDKELISMISGKLKEKDPNYFTIIEVDKKFA